MRIPCPFCGERDSREFTYLGDANGGRSSFEPSETNAYEGAYESVYVRDNPAGVHQELWHHAFGCRSWLRVKRDTRSHEIFEAHFA
jgi:heterotetrameric sarcosine oxidase delta subunit